MDLSLRSFLINEWERLCEKGIESGGGQSVGCRGAVGGWSGFDITPVLIKTHKITRLFLSFFKKIEILAESTLFLKWGSKPRPPA